MADHHRIDLDEAGPEVVTLPAGWWFYFGGAAWRPRCVVGPNSGGRPPIRRPDRVGGYGSAPGLRAR